MVCLDSSFIIDFLKGEEKARIMEEIVSKISEPVTVASPVIMEIIKGICLINKIGEKEKVMNFLSSLTVLDLNRESAILAGEIEADLIKRGEIIDIEDIMIAAIVIQHNEKLITRNIKHFEKISKLNVEKY